MPTPSPPWKGAFGVLQQYPLFRGPSPTGSQRPVGYQNQSRMAIDMRVARFIKGQNSLPRPLVRRSGLIGARKRRDPDQSSFLNVDKGHLGPRNMGIPGRPHVHSRLGSPWTMRHSAVLEYAQKLWIPRDHLSKISLWTRPGAATNAKIGVVQKRRARQEGGKSIASGRSCSGGV